MKKILGYSLAFSFIVLSPLSLRADEKVAATPSDEATALVSKQLGKLVDILKRLSTACVPLTGNGISLIPAFTGRKRNRSLSISRNRRVTGDAVTNAKERRRRRAR